MGRDFISGADLRGARCGRSRTARATTGTSSALPSDLTDEEWSLVEPLIPPAKRGGRRREVVVREVVNGVMYVLSTGCQWRYIPKDLPPRSTVHDYLARWTYDGTIERMHHALYVQCREMAVGGQPDGLRDRQPERQERGKRGACIDPSGYDAGKKINGKKRHILVDTLGLLLHAVVHPADIQDRDGGVLPALDPVRNVSLSGKAVRRCRLSRPAVRHRRGTNSAASRHRDSETLGSGEWLRGAADALGRRSVPWPGSIAAGASPKTSRTSAAPPWHFFSLRQSA